MTRTTMPLKSHVQRYWWTKTDGGYRFESNLFRDYPFHATSIKLWGEHGNAPVCFACCMSTGADGDSYVWLGRGHLVASAYGGSNELHNLVPLCQRCNGAMGRAPDRDTAVEWMVLRQQWTDYLADIDAVTPSHVPDWRVIVDAGMGIDYTPHSFVAKYGQESRNHR